MTRKNYILTADNVAASVTSASPQVVTSGAVFKRMQSGTAEPGTGFSGTPVAGDVYIRYTE